MTSNLKQKATEARKKVLEMVYKAQSSHIGSNFSVIDILTVLFDKADLNRDKIILSAGWKAASFYYFLAEKGIIQKQLLDTYCKEGSDLIGLTEPGVPGVLFAGGSMQMGLPAAVGFALSKKMKGEEGNIYCIMSDGELAGGMIWESALIASQHHLDNLIVIIDANSLQAMGSVEGILKSGFPKSGFSIHAVDGHNFEMLDRMMHVCNKHGFSPLCFIAKTTKGKGVSFLENDNKWHYKNISEAEYELALNELHG